MDMVPDGAKPLHKPSLIYHDQFDSQEHNYILI